MKFLVAKGIRPGICCRWHAVWCYWIRASTISTSGSAGQMITPCFIFYIFQRHYSQRTMWVEKFEIGTGIHLRMFSWNASKRVFSWNGSKRM